MTTHLLLGLLNEQLLEVTNFLKTRELLAIRLVCREMIVKTFNDFSDRFLAERVFERRRTGKKGLEALEDYSKGERSRCLKRICIETSGNCHTEEAQHTYTTLIKRSLKNLSAQLTTIWVVLQARSCLSPSTLDRNMIPSLFSHISEAGIRLKAFHVRLDYDAESRDPGLSEWVELSYSKDSSLDFDLLIDYYGKVGCITDPKGLVRLYDRSFHYFRKDRRLAARNLHTHHFESFAALFGIGNIKELNLHNCDMMEVWFLFSTTKLGEISIITNKLTSLKLSRCKLHVWSRDPLYPSGPNKLMRRSWASALKTIIAEATNLMSYSLDVSSPLAVIEDDPLREMPGEKTIYAAEDEEDVNKGFAKLAFLFQLPQM